jgi:hypothetical protein
MDNKIILKDGKNLIGVSSIVISELENSIYINNSSEITNGSSGSLAFYQSDNSSTLYGTGETCNWNPFSSTLTSTNIKITDTIKLSDFEIKVVSNEATNKYFRNSLKQTLIIDTFNSTKKCIAIAVDNSRVYLNSITNIKSKTIESSVGNLGDLAGDIAIDENYVCYCTKDFDGVSNIWKRSKLVTW